MSSRTKKILAFAAMLAGYFMALLDATIVNVSLPRMAAAYGTGIENISWIVNGYNLAFAVLILTAARVADQFGRKFVFAIGIAAFTVASALAAVAPSVEFLIVVRFIQGLAGAIIVPVSIPLAVDLLGIERQGLLMGIFGGMSGIAAASGPALGGILTSAFDWQSIFLVNIPIGIVALVLCIALVRESRDPSASRKPDIGGMISTSVALFGIVYALINANDMGWTSPTILVSLAVGVAGIIAFVFFQLRSADLMLPLGFLRDRVFGAANLAIVTMAAALIGSVFMVSFYLRMILGLDSLDAGLTLAFMPLSSMVFSVISGPLSTRWDSRFFSIVGLLIMCLAAWLFAGLGPDASRTDVILRLVLMGAGLGLSMSPLYGSAIRAVPVEKVGMASGLTNMARAVGGVLGVAILVSVLNGGLQTELSSVRTRATAVVQEDALLAPQVKTNFEQRIAAISFQNAQSAFDTKNLAMLPQSQKDEIAKLVPTLTAVFRSSASNAFSLAFRTAALISILAAILSLFSDRRKNRILAREKPVLEAGI